MKYLLDTHALLWVLFDDNKLSKKAKQIIRNSENEILVNIITYWEDVSTYFKLPKIKHKDPFDRLITWQAINNNITLISKDKVVKEYQAFGLNVLWD